MLGREGSAELQRGERREERGNPVRRERGEEGEERGARRRRKLQRSGES